MIRSNSCHSNSNRNNTNNYTASTKLINNNSNDNSSSNDLIINHTENTNNNNQNININKLRQRRQRNLTTSFRTNYTDFQHINNSKQEEKYINNNLDKFIDSLEDINNYLDKKLNENSLNANNINNNNRKKTANKLTRHFTQPILFNSNNYDNNKSSSKSNDINEKIKTNDTNNQVIMMIEEIGSKQNINNNNQNNKPTTTTTSTSTSSSNIILNKYHQKINNNNNIDNKLANFSSTNKQLPKKFVSLSDILNNEKNFETPNSILNNNSNTTNNINSLTAANNNNSNNKTIQQSINDLLTVQELFEELELDCDEQIKQLDEIERKRKENIKNPKEIKVNEIKPIATAVASAITTLTNNLTNDDTYNHSNKLNLNNFSSYSLASFANSSSSLISFNNKSCLNSNLNTINKRYEYLSNKFSSKLSSNQINRNKIDKIVYHDYKLKKLIQFDLINDNRKYYLKYNKKEDKDICVKKKRNNTKTKTYLIELIDFNHLINNEIISSKNIFDNYLYLIDYLTNDCKCLYKLKKIPLKNRSLHKEKKRAHQLNQQKKQNQEIYFKNNFISPTIKLESFLSSSTKMNMINNNNKIKIKPNTITSAPVQTLLDRRNAKLKSDITKRVMCVHLDNNDNNYNNELTNDNAISSTMVCRYTFIFYLKTLIFHD